MSTIDERIVSIKFNNRQFEAGIRTTMGSLDSLKKGLNFSAGVAALGELDAAGKKVTGPKLDGSGFQNSVKSTIDAASSLKSSLQFDGVTKSLSDLDSAGKKVSFKLDSTMFQNGAKGIVDAATTIKNNMNFDSVQRGMGVLKSSVQNFSMDTMVKQVSTGIRAIGELELAGKRFSLDGIANSVDKLSGKFEGLSVIGIGALASLGSKALDAGINMAKGMLTPMKDGLKEYETNMNSIQTIMANTQSKGTTMGEVNASLAELNTYSDKTIYNFSEMARNIGTFTSAGMGLKESTAAIKGISNLAALSGSDSQQASTAMYQLSQAMSTGVVKLQDWNSVVNAGMGGEVFQNALKETARNQGANVDGLIEKNGSFRDSLQEGWLTDKVMMETLSKMTGDLNDEQLASMGYNAEQIAGIQAMAKTASDAATKIKTFSQLVGTIAETAGSGWSQSFAIVLGDFEEAKALFTSINDIIGKMQNDSAQSRNDLLQGWKDKGGRTEAVLAVKSAFDVLLGVMTPIKEALKEVFPSDGGQGLFVLTKAIRIFIQALIPGVAATFLLKNSFKLLFSIIKIGVSIISGALSVVFAFFKAFATGGDSVAGSMKPFTDMLGTIADKIRDSTFIAEFFGAMAKGATVMGQAISKIIGIVLNLVVPFIQLGIHLISVITWSTLFAMYFGFIGDAIQSVGSVLIGFLGYLGRLSGAFRDAVSAFIDGGMDKAIDAFQNSLLGMGKVGEIVLTRVEARVASIRRFADRLAAAWDQVMLSVGKVWEKILPFRTAVSDLFGDLGNELKNVFTDVSFDDTLDMVNTGLLAGIVLLFKGLFKKLLGMGNGARDGMMSQLEGLTDSVKGVLSGMTDTLSAMQQNLKADTLMKIAMAIGILTISVVVLSMIDSGKLTKALIGIGVMVVILGKAMEALDRISVGSGFLKIPFLAAGMILLAIALAILVIPVKQLSDMSWGELIKGLTGTIALMIGLAKASEIMSKNPANLIATGLGLIAVAFAIKILASAVADIAALSFGSMIQGLIGVGALLTALSIFNNMTKVNAGSIATAAGLILLGFALKVMASAMADFAAMSVGAMIQGFVTLSAVLLVLSQFSSVVRPEGLIKTAAAMFVLGFALKVIASAMGDFATISWENTAKGLLIMVVALSAISQALGRVPPNMLLSAIGFIAVAVALKVLASALNDFAGMTWGEIAKGLVVLAASLIIIAAGMIAMTSALPGAAALMVVALALGVLAPVLQKFGDMSWEEMLKGFAALAGIFLIFGLAGLVLAPLVPILLGLGLAMLALGAGLMGVGIGTVLFAVGLVAIATAVAVSGPILIAFIGSILALLPLALTELGKGIVAFAGVIGDAMPIFLKAFVALLTTLLTAIDQVFPKLMATLWNLIVGLVDLIVKGVPLFIDAGMKIIIGILTGIGNNMGKLLDSATLVIVEFLDGLSRNLPKIIEAGVNLIISFIEGIAKSVRNNAERMGTAGGELASAIIEGMANGIANAGYKVFESIGKVASGAINKAKELLGIHSPSREFFKIGRFTTEGWANGTEKYGSLVVDATEKVGLSAMDVLKKTMSNVGDVVTDEMNAQPVIRPVLDLSAVKKDSALVSDMLRPPTIDVNSMQSRAAVLLAQDRSKREALNSESSSDTTQPPINHSVTYIQNNTSPKALSRAEIYRDTKNHLSTIKKGVPA